MQVWDFVLVAASFAGLLFGAGVIVKAVDKFSHKLKLSSFSISFFLLGILTSIPEFAVGLNAVSENKPDIFVGNLIGGVAIIFFLIIPILAIFGNGVRLSHQLSGKNLLFTFLAILAPSAVVFDRHIANVEGVILVAVYVILFLLIQRDKGVLDRDHTEIMHIRSYSVIDIFKILLGVGIVFVSSQVIVDKTIMVATQLGISTFYISLVALSLGTNLPEISLTVKSIINKHKEVAFGDYIGSAAANTFLFGLFTLISPNDVVTSTNYLKTFLMIAFGLGIFNYFTRSKQDISRSEGIILLLYYVVFVVIEAL